MVVSQDESEEITDDHDAEDDLDHDADDLDDVDVGEDASEHLGTEDLDIQTKEKDIIKVTFSFSKLTVHKVFSSSCVFLKDVFLILQNFCR